MSNNASKEPFTAAPHNTTTTAPDNNSELGSEKLESPTKAKRPFRWAFLIVLYFVLVVAAIVLFLNLYR